MKYTPEEVAELLKERPNQPHYIRALIGKCVRAAVLAEREACAKACKGVSEEYRGTTWWKKAEKICDNCADAIRARGDQ